MAYILVDSKDTYFEILPQEINLLIISLIPDKDLDEYRDVLVYNWRK